VIQSCKELREERALWIPLLRSPAGFYSLFHAITKHDLARIQWLCEQIYYPLTQCDPNDRSLIGYCVRHKAPLSLVDYLCSRGAPVDQLDKQKETPLVYAIQDHQYSMVETLIRQGADPNCVCNGSSPLCHAIRNGDLTMVELLCALGADALEDQAIGCAVRYGHLPILLELLEHGASVETTDPKGNSLLHYAAQFNCVELCAYLLAFLDVNRLNAKQRSPILFAGTVEIWDQLQAAGANLNHSDINGWTALHYATHHRRIPIVKRLLENGASKDRLTHSGMTALDLAIVKDFQEIVELLSPS